MSINQVGPDVTRTNTDNGYEYGVTVTGGGNTATKTGFKATVNAKSGSTIASGTVISAIMATADDLSGTHTGSASPFHVPTPTAGTWDRLVTIGGFATGCVDLATITLDSLTVGSVGALAKIRVGSSDFLIPCMSTITHA